MKLLVGYAGAHGSAREIAERIATKLCGAGIEAGCLSLGHVKSTASHDACVLSGAIHNRAWLRPAEEFVSTNRALLNSRPNAVLAADASAGSDRSGRERSCCRIFSHGAPALPMCCHGAWGESKPLLRM